MFNVSKKIIIYILVGFLTFSTVSVAYYRSVHAMEWVGGSLAFEEALKWLLACIGITATGGMASSYWDAYGDEFTEKAIEDGCTQTEVTEWQMKACEGVLDKASDVWSSFKNWAKSLVVGSFIGGSDNIVESGLTYPATCNDIINFVNTNYGGTYPLYNSDERVSNFLFSINSSTNKVTYLSMNVTEGVVSYIQDNTYYSTPYSNSGSVAYISGSWSHTTNSNLGFWTGANSKFVSDNITIVNGDYSIVSYTSNASVIDNNFQTVTNDIDNLDVISSDLPDKDAKEVNIPMPGLADSDNSASADAYDDIINAINNGQISIDDGLTQIQDLLKIITYDTVTDDVIPVNPDSDSGENEKVDDKISKNKNNMEFTLYGLEKVFPFCIPWDIYAFFNILNADPVAPIINIPLLVSTERTENIEIDLSKWNTVFLIWRYALDLLFIVGLALSTRNIIGAGGGD